MTSPAGVAKRRTAWCGLWPALPSSGSSPGLLCTTAGGKDSGRPCATGAGSGPSRPASSRKQFRDGFRGCATHEAEHGRSRSAGVQHARARAATGARDQPPTGGWGGPPIVLHRLRRRGRALSESVEGELGAPDAVDRSGLERLAPLPAVADTSPARSCAARGEAWDRPISRHGRRRAGPRGRVRHRGPARCDCRAPVGGASLARSRAFFGGPSRPACAALSQRGADAEVASSSDCRPRLS